MFVLKTSANILPLFIFFFSKQIHLFCPKPNHSNSRHHADIDFVASCHEEISDRFSCLPFHFLTYVFPRKYSTLCASMCEKVVNYGKGMS